MNNVCYSVSHPNSLSQHTHGCARTLADINALYWVTSLLPLAFLSFWDTLQIVIWPGGTIESGLTSGLLISRAPRLPWSDKQLSFQELLEFFNYSRSWDGLQGRGGSISFVYHAEELEWEYMASWKELKIPWKTNGEAGLMIVSWPLAASITEGVWRSGNDTPV